MLRFLSALLIAVLLPVSAAHAFCGFYVSQAGTDLFNEASKVVLARDGERTVVTMANDFQGEAQDFAIVVPVPEVLQESQINVGENRMIEHLDAYTAPRLVEYFDENPCQPRIMMEMMRSQAVMSADMAAAPKADRAQALGVKIEASYTVGEYDIDILSAEQSEGLFKYLNAEGYKLPKGADKILGSYIKQDMKFFVAKVNLEEQAKAGYTFLRPIQIAYESEKFMLPIRLGTLNAKGPQDLFIFALTRNGRVETNNYRTVKIPSDIDLPLFVKEEFDEIYPKIFDRQVEKDGMKNVYLEYAWDMGWCDPCAADPLPREDLIRLGAFWLLEGEGDQEPMGSQPQIMPRMPRPMPQAQDVFVTRLHVRYTAENFPEDLMLHETADRQNFQGRYVLRHPFKGKAYCEAGADYFGSLPQRFEREAQNLANLSGMPLQEVRERMEASGQSFTPRDVPARDPRPWWEKMWDEGKRIGADG